VPGFSYIPHLVWYAGDGIDWAEYDTVWTAYIVRTYSRRTSSMSGRDGVAAVSSREAYLDDDRNPSALDDLLVDVHRVFRHCIRRCNRESTVNHGCWYRS
jgi:hypothetical protein